MHRSVCGFLKANRTEVGYNDETVRKGKRLNVMTRSVNSFDNGRYRQTGIIHDGLYSDIFEVYDNDTGQRQALKVLKLINGDLATQRALFDKEVISLTRLRHPAVVQLKRYFTDDNMGALCIALEYIPNPVTLRELIEGVENNVADKKELQWSLMLLDQLIDGLEKAHQLDIVHRDFNPNNIVIGRGGNGEVKVIDFGIAKLLDQFGTTHVSLPNFLTYPYVSPEQTANLDLNIEHDYFTYGLVALALLTWTLPKQRHLLGHGDINALLEKLPVHVPDPLYAERLKSLILALTQHDSSARPRPAHIKQVLEEVRLGLGERPLLGVKVSSKIEEKTMLAGFHSPQAFFNDLNQGTLAHYRETPRDGRKAINVHFFGKNTWLLTRTDEWNDNQEQLVAVDGGRLEAGAKWQQRNAKACRYRLDQGVGNAKKLMDELFERQELDTRTRAEETRRREFFELSAHILDRETERAKHMTLAYDQLDTKTNPGYYRLHIRGVIAQHSETSAAPMLDLGLINDALIGLDEESRFAYGVAKRRPRAVPRPGETDRADQSSQPKQKAIGTFHSFLPKTQTLLIRKTGSVTLPKEGLISHIDQGLLKSIDRQRGALMTFIKDRAVNPYLSDRLMAPGTTNSIGSRQQLTLIQNLRPEATIQRILSHALAAQDFFALQGPPGTGKTTFTAELVAQILKQDKRARVLLTAQPNSAVEHAMHEFRELTKQGYRSLVLTRDNNEIDDAFGVWSARVVVTSQANVAKILPTLDENKRARVAAIVQDWQARLPESYDAQVDYVRSAQVYGTTCSKIPVLTERMNNEPFDWVIVDEAAKALDTEVLMALVEGKRFIMVGDHKQLPPYLDHGTKQELMAAGFGAEQITTSLFEKMFHKLPLRNRERLTTQFRMHSSIGEFVGQLFYEGTLQHGTPDEERDLPLPLVERFDHRVIWLNTAGHETYARPGYYNVAEAKRIQTMLTGLNGQAKVAGREYTVSVIAPYKAQVDLLEQTVVPTANHWSNMKITVATIDSFQGKQSDVVLYSLVRTSLSNLEFVADPQRVNVACSRAKRLLVIFGQVDTLRQNALFDQAIRLLPSSNVVGV